jgi:hypothetical protein
MKKQTLGLSILLCACVIFGLFIPFWPLVFVAIALAALYTPLYVAVALALAADLLFGVPTGILSPLHFLFFIFALSCYFMKLFALRFIREREDFNRI